VRLLFAIPGDIEAPTGGYAYARRVLAALPAEGIDALHLALSGDFPQPSNADITAAVRFLRDALAPGDVVLMDGLAFGALPADAIAAIPAPIVALCHHPLYLETGLTAARRDALHRSECAALALAPRVIVTSPHTGETLIGDFGVERSKLAVALPGVDRASRARGSGGAPALLAVGALVPRKGFDLLIAALAGLADLDWRLRIVGSRDPSPQTAAALDALIQETGLGAQVKLCGEVADAELERLYDTSDVFVSASHYEGYGMALAEALAHGLPIVTTTGGAPSDTAPDAAALKIPPGDVDALRRALRRVIVDTKQRTRLADAAWRAGQALPKWEATAAVIAAVARDVGRRQP
jgi:glycosyltransferase involved in cell wall biosynthesis